MVSTPWHYLIAFGFSSQMIFAHILYRHRRLPAHQVLRSIRLIFPQRAQTGTYCTRRLIPLLLLSSGNFFVLDLYYGYSVLVSDSEGID